MYDLPGRLWLSRVQKTTDLVYVPNDPSVSVGSWEEEWELSEDRTRKLEIESSWDWNRVGGRGGRRWTGERTSVGVGPLCLHSADTRFPLDDNGFPFLGTDPESSRYKTKYPTRDGPLDLDGLGVEQALSLIGFGKLGCSGTFPRFVYYSDTEFTSV